jgi:preprotein translocase subunit YajC
VSFLIVMVMLLVVMYVLMIRPQRKRQQDARALIHSAGVGDDILTNGGIYGTIVQIEGDDVVVEIADGVKVHMTRQGITAVLPPEDEEQSDEPELEHESDDVDGAELDEGVVTAVKEAVTTEADADTTAGNRR